MIVWHPRVEIVITSPEKEQLIPLARTAIKPQIIGCCRKGCWNSIWSLSTASRLQTGQNSLSLLTASGLKTGQSDTT